MQSVFDKLYENSLAKRGFKNLISIITTEENIKLAYNSYVMGIHNYYGMATAANPDMQTLAYEIKISIKNRLQERVKRRSNRV